jgi:hypothetical protein
LNKGELSMFKVTLGIVVALCLALAVFSAIYNKLGVCAILIVCAILCGIVLSCESVFGDSNASEESQFVTIKEWTDNGGISVWRIVYDKDTGVEYYQHEAYSKHTIDMYPYYDSDGSIGIYNYADSVIE